MADMTAILWNDVAPYGDNQADRRVIAGRGGDLKRVFVKAGTVAQKHSHDFEQFFVVLEGAGVLTTAQGNVDLQPGLVVHFEPKVWHSAVFDADTVLLEVNFVSE